MPKSEKQKLKLLIIKDYLERNTDEEDSKAPNELQQTWKAYVKRFVFTTLITSVLCIAVMSIMLHFGKPIVNALVSEEWSHTVLALAALIFCSPFLWMLMRGGVDRPEVDKLWEAGARWRVRLTAHTVLRLFIAAVFVSYIVDYAVPWSSWLGMFALVGVLIFIFFSPHLQKDSNKLVQNFTENLSARERMNEQK